MKNKVIATSLVLLGLVAVATAIYIRNSDVNLATASSSYPPPDVATQSGTLENTQNYCEKQRAKNAALSPDSKPIMSDSEYAKCIAALTASPGNKAVKPTEKPVPTTVYTEDRPRRVAGNGIIIHGLLGNYSPTVFLQTNVWYGKIGNKVYYLYGGVARNASPDLTQNAIALDVYDLSGKPLPDEGGIYLAPTQAGTLVVIDANGDQITMAYPDGQVVLFNIGARKFVAPNANQKSSPITRKSDGGVIVETGISQLAGDFKLSNQWFKNDNGTRTSVFAGKTKGSDSKGVVLIVTSIGEPSSTDKYDSFSVPDFSPVSDNTIRILKVETGKVFLVSNLGQEFIFDLNAKRFLAPSEISALNVDKTADSVDQQIKNGVPEDQNQVAPTLDPAKSAP